MEEILKKEIASIKKRQRNIYIFGACIALTLVGLQISVSLLWVKIIGIEKILFDISKNFSDFALLHKDFLISTSALLQQIICVLK